METADQINNNSIKRDKLVDQWIDVHAHFYPPETPQQRKDRWQAMKADAWLTPAPPGWDPESTLLYMDKTGIAMQLLSNIPKSLERLQASNDYGASLVRKYPARFGLLAALRLMIRKPVCRRLRALTRNWMPMASRLPVTTTAST